MGKFSRTGVGGVALVVMALVSSACGVHVSAHFGAGPPKAATSSAGPAGVADQELTAEAINALPSPPPEWTLMTLENITDSSLVNAGTCLDRSTFSTSVAGTRVMYGRQLSAAKGTVHGQYLVSIRATHTPDEAMQQLTALQNLSPACATEIAREDVPGVVDSAATQARSLPLSLPGVSYRTVAHYRSPVSSATVYYVDLVYLVAGRIRATVGFLECCGPIEDSYQATILDQVQSELQTLAHR